MKLIDDCKAAFHHYSTIALAMASSLQGVWISIPEEVRTSLPGWVPQTVAWVTLAVALAGLGGKFIAQTPPEPKP